MTSQRIIYIRLDTNFLAFSRKAYKVVSAYVSFRKINQLLKLSDCSYSLTWICTFYLRNF